MNGRDHGHDRAHGRVRDRVRDHDRDFCLHEHFYGYERHVWHHMGGALDFQILDGT